MSLHAKSTVSNIDTALSKWSMFVLLATDTQTQLQNLSIGDS